MATVQYPADLPKFWTYIGLAQYNRTTITSAGTVTPTDLIILPLPLNPIDNHQVQYDEQPLGPGGALIDNIGAGPGSALGAGILNGITSILGQTSLSPQQQQQSILALLGGNIAGAVAQGGIDAARVIGYSPNEYVTILLKGPKYKRHTLKWKFSADEFRESAALRNIINMINNAMAPGTYASGLLFTFPKIFQVAYMPNPGYLYKFKPAVCEAFITNFSGGGAPAFYRDGQGEPNPGWQGGGGTHNAPESIEMEMHLIELEYWLTGDFKQTNYPFDGYASSR